MRPFALPAPFTLLIAALLAGCDQELDLADPSATVCNPGVAQIAVYDGILQNLCGCAEAQGTTSVPPATLTCTVASGTVMIFQFPNNQMRHQILSVGTPSFVSSPLIDPNSDQPVPAYAVPLSTAGTYRFEDAFQATLAGQVVVY